MKKKLSLIMIICGLVCIGIAIFLIMKPSDHEQNDSNKIEEIPKELTHKEEVEQILINYFLSKETSSDKIKSIMGDKFILNNYIVLGKDSYLRSVPGTTDELKEYISIQEKYATNVEEKYLTGTSYTIEEQGENLIFHIKPWYFALYSSDLSHLANKLLEMTNFNFNLMETDYEQYEVYVYKAKVKAMMIMDSYLENYQNQDEVIDFIFYYNDDTPAENQYFSLYLNLVGDTSKSMQMDSEYQTLQDERINQYIVNAQKQGIITEDNILEFN